MTRSLEPGVEKVADEVRTGARAACKVADEVRTGARAACSEAAPSHLAKQELPPDFHRPAKPNNATG